jgi:hypothetical protein
MFVRIVRANGKQLITYACTRVVQNYDEREIEVELPNGDYRTLELDSGDRVFLMNESGKTIDGVVIGE